MRASCRTILLIETSITFFPPPEFVVNGPQPTPPSSCLGGWMTWTKWFRRREHFELSKTWIWIHFTPCIFGDPKVGAAKNYVRMGGQGKVVVWRKRLFLRLTCPGNTAIFFVLVHCCRFCLTEREILSPQTKRDGKEIQANKQRRQRERFGIRSVVVVNVGFSLQLSLRQTFGFLCWDLVRNFSGSCFRESDKHRCFYRYSERYDRDIFSFHFLRLPIYGSM